MVIAASTPSNCFDFKQFVYQAIFVITDFMEFDTFAYGDGVNPDIKLSANFAVNNAVIGFANGWVAGPWTPPGMDTLDGIDC